MADGIPLLPVQWLLGYVGGPIYVIGMIDRWAWLAHGPQMCCFLPLLHCSVAVLYYSVLCWGLLLSIEIGLRLRTDLGPT